MRLIQGRMNGAMMAKVPRPTTAFSKDHRSASQPKQPAIKDKAHRIWIKTLPCVVTTAYGVDPAHISYRDARFGKGPRGKGEKADDWWVVPLCREQHDKQEFQMNEIEYWKSVDIDPCIVALSLWANSGNDHVAKIILSQAKGNRRYG